MSSPCSNKAHNCFPIFRSQPKNNSQNSSEQPASVNHFHVQDPQQNQSENSLVSEFLSNKDNINLCLENLNKILVIIENNKIEPKVNFNNVNQQKEVIEMIYFNTKIEDMELELKKYFSIVYIDLIKELVKLINLNPSLKKTFAFHSIINESDEADKVFYGHKTIPEDKLERFRESSEFNKENCANIILGIELLKKDHTHWLLFCTMIGFFASSVIYQKKLDTLLGFVKNSMIEGFATRVVDGKITFLGNCENGLANGFGISINNDTGIRLEGMWKDGDAHGYSLRFKPNGDLMERMYENGELSKNNGYTLMTKANGEFNESIFLNKEKKHGYSIQTNHKGDKFELMYKDGIKDGYATFKKERYNYSSRLTHKNNNIEFFVVLMSNKFFYAGTVYNNNKEGFGVICDPKDSSSYYKGFVKNELKHGSFKFYSQHDSNPQNKYFEHNIELSAARFNEEKWNSSNSEFEKAKNGFFENLTNYEQEFELSKKEFELLKKDFQAAKSVFENARR